MYQRTFRGLGGLALLIVVGSAGAQSYDLSWFTVDGGGAMLTSGGTFTLSGTIGQPDAGSPATPMTGGTFSVVGGFWPGTGSTCALPGDMDLNSVRDGADIEGFVNCLLATGVNCACADLDGNGTLNSADVSAFVLALLT